MKLQTKREAVFVCAPDAIILDGWFDYKKDENLLFFSLRLIESTI
jgi:hypothetical protein